MSATTPQNTPACSQSSLLITGGAGFIGSNFVQSWINDNRGIDRLVVIDKMHHSANPHNLPLSTMERRTETYDGKEFTEYVGIDGKLVVIVIDINETAAIQEILRDYSIDGVIHFAARSHVDESQREPFEYVRDNVLGTTSLLEATRRHTPMVKKFIHVSTDEVYGEHVGDDGFAENRLLIPTNPQAGSKAATEMMVWPYLHSQNVPLLISRGNNVQGPRQHNEKMVPRFISKFLAHEPCTIAGDGRQTRSFIHIDDVVDAFWCMLYHGAVGEVQNIGSGHEHTILEVQEELHRIFAAMPENDQKFDEAEKTRVFVADRSFNDKRQWINDNKLRNIGWHIQKTFDVGLRETVEWQCKNAEHQCTISAYDDATQVPV